MSWETHRPSPANRLTSAVVTVPASHDVDYTYDPLGRRYQKDVDKTPTSGLLTNYLHDGDEEIADYDVNPSSGVKTLLRRYVYGPGVDERIAMVTAAGVKTFYHRNHQGSTVAMTGSTGTDVSDRPTGSKWLAIANGHSGLAGIYKDTQWGNISGSATGGWGQSLKRAPGASAKTMRIQGRPVRCTLIPWSLVFPDGHGED